MMNVIDGFIYYALNFLFIANEFLPLHKKKYRMLFFLSNKMQLQLKQFSGIQGMSKYNDIYMYL